MTSRNQREGRYAGYCHQHKRQRHRLRVSTANAKLQQINKGNRWLFGNGLRKPVHPKPMSLDSNTVMEAAKRVMETHGDVIKALGNR